MGIRLRRSKIEITGNVTLDDLVKWSKKNTRSATFVHDRCVEAIHPIEIGYDATFDTSEGHLIINDIVRPKYQEEYWCNSIWRCNGGMVTVKTDRSIYSEEWCPMQWDDVQVLMYVEPGNGALFRSDDATNGRGDHWLNNVRLMLKKGDLDMHLQYIAGSGVIKNLEVTLSDGTGFMLLRDTDSDGLMLRGANLGGWNNPVKNNGLTTFHKNLRMSSDSVNDHYMVMNYRRKNWPIFYNARNIDTGQRFEKISYQNPGAYEGTNQGRGVIVSKFAPILKNGAGNVAPNVNIDIHEVNGNVNELTAVTGSDGMVWIIDNNDDERYTSLIWNNRIINEAGVMYVKKSVTPSNGGPVVSVIKPEFRIRMRNPAYNFYESVFDFLEDFTGDKLVVDDPDFADTFNGVWNDRRELNGHQELYDHYKMFLSLPENMHIPPLLEKQDTEIVSNYSIIFDRNLSKSFELRNDILYIRADEFIGEVRSAGLVQARNGSKINGGVEDINGARILFTAAHGGRFNMIARVRGKGTLLGFEQNVTEATYRVKRGEIVDYSMWSLGYRVYTGSLGTANGGVSQRVQMSHNRYIDTTIDVGPILAGIRSDYTHPQYTIIFSKPMSLSIEQIKTFLHYVVGSESSLGASLGLGTEVSILEIMKDEIKINLPYIKIIRDPILAITDRVELNGYINVEDAVKIDPTFVMNPSDINTGLYVTTLNVKPSVDPVLLANVFKEEMKPVIGLMEMRLIETLKR